MLTYRQGIVVALVVLQVSFVFYVSGTTAAHFCEKGAEAAYCKVHRLIAKAQ